MHFNLRIAKLICCTYVGLKLVIIIPKDIVLSIRKYKFGRLAQCLWSDFSGIWIMSKFLVQVVMSFGNYVMMLIVGIFLIVL